MAISIELATTLRRNRLGIVEKPNLPVNMQERIVAPGINCPRNVQSLNFGARFSIPAIIASFRSADMSMAAFQVAM